MKPILFNTEMVQAILDGRKTTTRRVIKPQPRYIKASGRWVYQIPEKQVHAGCCTAVCSASREWWEYLMHDQFPYQLGDILYVRETFCPYDAGHVINGVKYAYKADSTPESEEVRKAYGYKWKPSIFMPKDAARIFLKVTDVKAEQLHDITEEQIKQEGIEFVSGYDVRDIPLNTWDYFEMLFKRLWNSTIKKSDLPLYGWDANPWVWVISFERCEKPKEEA